MKKPSDTGKNDHEPAKEMQVRIITEREVDATLDRLAARNGPFFRQGGPLSPKRSERERPSGDRSH